MGNLKERAQQEDQRADGKSIWILIAAPGREKMGGFVNMAMKFGFQKCGEFS